MGAKKEITLEQVITALRETNGNISLTGRKLGVTRQAIQYYVDNYVTAAAALKEASAYISDIAEGHLVNAVIKGNLEQVKYWLENKARDRGYGARYNVEVTGKDGGAIPFVFSHAAALAALTSRPASDIVASGTDEGGSDGA